MKIFELGINLRKRRKEDFQKFEEHLAYLKRRTRKEPVDDGEDYDGQIPENLHLLSQEEKERITESIKDELVKKNLLQGETPSSEIADHSQLEEYLLSSYNQPSKFLAERVMNIAAAHLTIQEKRNPSASHVAQYIDYISNSFTKIYCFKPSLRQLALEIAHESYYSHSHTTLLTEFMGIESDYEMLIKKNALTFKDLKTLILQQQYDKKTLKQLSKQLGLKGKIEEIEKMLFFSDIVSEECNTEEPVEVLLAAKEGLGGMEKIFRAEEVNDILEEQITKSMPEGVKPEDGLTQQEIDDYYKNHYKDKTNIEIRKAFNNLFEELGLVYPSFLFNFDAKRGFRSYGVSEEEEGVIILPYNPKTSDDGGSMGKFNPYGENRFSWLLKKHGLDSLIDPLFEGEKVKIEQKFSKTHDKPLNRFVSQFNKYKSKGEEGIIFDMDSERPNGCLTPEEVLERRYAICLEHAFLFLAINKDLERNVLAFKVFRDEEGTLTPHVCNGVLLGAYDNLKDISLSEYKSRISYYRFEKDEEFRAELERKGIEIRGKKLILMDLSFVNFGAQYQEIRPMIDDEEILSAHFVDRGSYYIKKDMPEVALENFETALRINPKDELARSHLIAYFSDIEKTPEKVLELSNNFSLLVNPEDFVFRSEILLSLNDFQGAFISLINALQISKNHKRAQSFLKKLRE